MTVTDSKFALLHEIGFKVTVPEVNAVLSSQKNASLGLAVEMLPLILAVV